MGSLREKRTYESLGGELGILYAMIAVTYMAMLYTVKYFRLYVMEWPLIPVTVLSALTGVVIWSRVVDLRLWVRTALGNALALGCITTASTALLRPSMLLDPIVGAVILLIAVQALYHAVVGLGISLIQASRLRTLALTLLYVLYPTLMSLLYLGWEASYDYEALIASIFVFLIPYPALVYNSSLGV